MRPEQQAALDYVERHGSQASLESILRRFRSTVSAMEGAVEGVSAEQAVRQPTAGSWCVQEVVDHLVETNRAGVEELRHLLAGQRPPEAPIPAGLVSDAPLEKEWEALKGGLAAVHRDFLALLEGADDHVPQEAKAPVVMVVKAKAAGGGVETLEWIEDFDWKAYAILFRAHTLEHVAQVQRILDSVRDGGGQA